MGILEKMEQFIVETDWKNVGVKIKTVILSLDEKVKNTKMEYLKKLEKEKEEK